MAFPSIDIDRLIIGIRDQNTEVWPDYHDSFQHNKTT